MTSRHIASAALWVSALVLLPACGPAPETSAPATPTASPAVVTDGASAPPSTPATEPSASPGIDQPARGSIIAPTPSVVRSPSDAAQASTPELRAFLEAQIAQLTTGCTQDPKPELNLSRMRVDDLITGDSRECGGGGAAFLWAKVDGAWKVAALGQAPPMCSELRVAGVTTTIPDDFVGHECMTRDGLLVTYDPAASD